MLSAARRRVIQVLALLASSLAAPPLLADAFDPLPTYNQSPLIQIFGLPAPGSARVLAGGQRQVRVTFEAANNFLAQQSGNELIVLDGETHRAAVTLAYGTGAADWGIEIPYLTHSGGFLDDFIRSWHDFFGLPQGGRDEAPSNALHFLYRRDGIDRLNISGANRGIGDVRLLAGRQVSLADGADVALRTSLKLPTGDSAELHGSGATDLALWLSAACAAQRCSRGFGWNAEVGLLALGHGDVLSDLQRRWVAFGGGGIAWRVWQPIVLKAELRAHSPFYRDSGLRPLGATATQLLLGGTWIIGPGTSLDITVSEDIRIDTAPDVSILASLRTRF